MGILLSMSTDMTTVKVRRATRERLSRAAREQHSTIDEYLTRLLDEAMWREQMALARACMADADEEYAADAEAWDATSGDRWTDATR